MISFYKNGAGVVMYRDDSYLSTLMFTIEHPATASDIAAHPDAYAAFTAVGQTLTASFPSGTTGTIQFTRTLVAAPFTKTLIAGAVANSVNSLTYQESSADSGYNVGVDFSNQVSSGGSPATNAQAAIAPAINGTPTVGTPLSITAGTFTGGSPAPSLSRVIYSGNTAVSTSGSYTPVAADVGQTFTVDDIATNSAGVTHNMSGNSAPCVAAATTPVLTPATTSNAVGNFAAGSTAV